MKRSIHSTILLLAIAVLTACGGSTNSDSTPSAASSSEPVAATESDQVTDESDTTPTTEVDKAHRVFVVRHAEKILDGGSDPELTLAGQRRAAALATRLADIRLAAVVTTQLLRTQQTGAPTAQAQGLEPIVVTVTQDVALHAQEVARTVRGAGGNVLVVGHSNTVPAIVEALGAPRPAPIDEVDYDNLFEVILGRGDATVTRHELAAE